MRIAKVRISYDRGIQYNAPQDVGLDVKPKTTPDGRAIRGLGTHFRSEEVRLQVAERDRESQRILRALKRRFMVSPLEGIYISNAKGEVREFIDSLNVRNDVKVSVTDMNLTADGMPMEEMKEWSERVKKQLQTIPYGRKVVDEEGLKALEDFAACPMLGRSTKESILDLVEAVRNDPKLTAMDVKRRVDMLDVELDGEALSPDRSVVLMDTEPSHG